MPYKLGALVIHGMGSQGPGFADEMTVRVNRHVSRAGADPAEIAWKAVHWAPILQPKQDRLWADLSQAHRLDWTWLRKFIISNFGDAIAYLKRVPSQLPDVYTRIHEEVHQKVAALRRDLGGADRPLVVIAHSLGSIIMSNYIWDEQSGQGFGGTAFERMETLAGFFTFGSNIALVSLAYDPITSITFPPPTLASYFPPGTPPTQVKSAAKWLNFFDRDDVLAYPLRPLSPSYGAAVTRDQEINVGGLLKSWNPASHGSYWTDKDFTRPVASAIADLLKLL